ncbi:hypothetical protein [Pseudomonas sp.]|uniref:hypothetical protein n=1 Tax=Pseudomonas sp. TaxID=306 RepID=UPI002730E0C7|nr:hypothetical protein [Pseudomonas sp.]MDP2244062.1 hypothetical protein [Pseudomonas sp.]
MTESPTVQRINAQANGITLAQAIALLNRANRYVGTHSTIGGQALGVEITEFVASHQRAQQ